MRSRRGFTLLEMMLASAVSAVVAVALGTFFIGVHRLVRQSSSVAQASLDLRAERDHLLFHSVHEGGNAYWGGLLSASRLEGVSSSGVRYTATGVDRSSGHPMSRSGQSYPNSVAAHADVGVGFADGDVRRRNLYAIRLTRTVGKETLAERVVVPIFGLEQRKGTPASDVFYDGISD